MNSHGTSKVVSTEKPEMVPGELGDLEFILEIKTRVNGGSIFLPALKLDDQSEYISATESKQGPIRAIFSGVWGLPHKGYRLHVTNYRTGDEVVFEESELTIDPTSEEYFDETYANVAEVFLSADQARDLLYERFGIEKALLDAVKEAMVANLGSGLESAVSAGLAVAESALATG